MARPGGGNAGLSTRTSPMAALREQAALELDGPWLVLASVAAGPGSVTDGLASVGAGQVSLVDRVSQPDFHEERSRHSRWIPQMEPGLASHTS